MTDPDLQDFEDYLATFRPAAVRRPRGRSRALRLALIAACAALLALIAWLAWPNAEIQSPGSQPHIVRDDPKPSAPRPDRPEAAPAPTLMSSRALIGDDEKLFAYLESPEQHAAVARGPLGALFRAVMSPGRQ